MHLPYLRELDDRFEIAALCDMSPATLDAVARRFGVTRCHARWQDLVADDLDAVLVLTSGSHAAPAIAAARAGRHVFVEKPMCYTVREADAMIAAAAQAGVVLMVGNVLRFDPAYTRMQPLVSALPGLRLAQITTLEAPLLPYVAHLGLHRFADVPEEARSTLKSELGALEREALGADVPEAIRRVYADVLLDTLVHEVNAIRGLLGEPESVTSAEAWMGTEGVTTVLRFPGDVRCVLTWVNLPVLRHYSMEFAFYGPADRLTLRYPSPFLTNEPTDLVIEGTEDGAPFVTSVTVSYEEAFKRELLHFHECMVKGTTPLTSGEEGRQDLIVLQAIARAMAERSPQEIPGCPAMGANVRSDPGV
jgi:predicted dehydrogenase